jgi:hypothetical protein
MEIGRAGAGRGRVRIASGIRAAVDAELRVAYPQRVIVAGSLPTRHSGTPSGLIRRITRPKSMPLWREQAPA